MTEKDQQKNPRQAGLFGTYADNGAPVVSPEMETYRESMEALSMLELQASCRSMGFPTPKRKKADLVSILLYVLSFEGKETSFRAWFGSLPRYLSYAISEAAFQGYVPVKSLEPLAELPVLLNEKRAYYYTDHDDINPQLRLGFFTLYRKHEKELLFLKEPFGHILSRWLPKPEGYAIRPSSEQPASGWDTTQTLSESMPLLLEGVEVLLRNDNLRDKVLRRGLTKTEMKELRRSSAFPEFPIAGKYGSDPINLIARFTMIDPERFLYSRKTDIRDHIRLMLKTFLEIPADRMITSYYRVMESNFEFSVLATWLSRKPGYGRYISFLPFPPSRILFRQFLMMAAKNGAWFSVDEAAEAMRLQGLRFTFSHSRGFTDEIQMKGETLRLPACTIHSNRWEAAIHPDQFLEPYLVSLPLLRGYCYLMASLGILRIREREPDKPVTLNGKNAPISPYDGLTHIRITPFGAWCLGVSTEKPELAAVEYEAIADKELPLVTYRGSSLECRAFLQLIGDPIGEERFRITAGSFIRGCKEPREIDQRIRTFKRLICPKPSTVWTSLFGRVQEGTRLFHDAQECLMVQLPPDRDLRRLFTDDPMISRLVTRAEGGRIVVKNRDYGKLRKALEEHGFLDW